MVETGFDEINQLARKKIPFLCLIDFDQLKPLVYQLSEIDPSQLKYEINGMSNAIGATHRPTLTTWNRSPISKDRYRRAFDQVQHHLARGDTFLLNLTFPTSVDTNLNLEEIFTCSHAKYKVWLKDHFVTFSPEPFIRIHQGIISSFPMKGTIRSSEPNATEVILNNRKETEEHLTIVDLIRNDLAMVAEQVIVEQFRYVEPIKTSQADLLQVSSKISGKLQSEFWPNLGDLLLQLLPAGSISGAPKKKTIEIIKQAEGYQRGYFTGIVGLFDGESFDSGVMIRFIEQSNHDLNFKSGGGITVNSEWEKEYQEMIDKVYVPII